MAGHPVRGGCFLHPPSSRQESASPSPDAAHERPGDHIATEDPRINDRIRAREVRLIGADGSQLGVQSLPTALQMARDADFDLVEVAPNADPPVCKIMDYERYKYEQQQKRKESKRKATQVVIKEMKFRPKIDQHDYSTKMRHVGREMAHPELGLRILERIADEVGEIAIVESAPRQDGRNMTMVLHPLKKGQTPGPKAGASRRSAPRAPAESATAEPAPAAAPESGAT
jgi:translation initiation factor IF-3